MAEVVEVRKNNVRELADQLDIRLSLPLMPKNYNVHRNNSNPTKPNKPMVPKRIKSSGEPRLYKTIQNPPEKSEKPKDIVKCRLESKSISCQWEGQKSQFKDHCQKDHAYEHSISFSNMIKRAGRKFTKDCVSVRFFDDKIFWCHQSFKIINDLPRLYCSVSVCAEESLYEYGYTVSYFLDGNPHKVIKFEESCFTVKEMERFSFEGSRCIEVPLKCLTLYFNVGDDFICQIHCEINIYKMDEKLNSEPTLTQ